MSLKFVLSLPHSLKSVKIEASTSERPPGLVFFKNPEQAVARVEKCAAEVKLCYSTLSVRAVYCGHTGALTTVESTNCLTFTRYYVRMKH